jgi:hypothetical protein
MVASPEMVASAAQLANPARISPLRGSRRRAVVTLPVRLDGQQARARNETAQKQP